MPDEANLLIAFPAHTDTGRKTTTYSEFTLRIEPRNFGVMLRRKLDYQHPNQQAKVFIAEEKDAFALASERFAPPAWSESHQAVHSGGGWRWSPWRRSARAALESGPVRSPVESGQRRNRDDAEPVDETTD